MFVSRSNDVKRLNRRTARDVDGTYDLIHSWYTGAKIDEVCKIVHVEDHSPERAYIEARWESLVQYAVSYQNAYPHIFYQPMDALVYFTLQALQKYNHTPMHGNRDDYNPSIRGAPSMVGEFIDSRNNSVFDITQMH